MADVELAIERIMDRYEYRELLELIFGYDCLAEDIINMTGVEDEEETS